MKEENEKLELIEPEVGGGRISRERIDSIKGGDQIRIRISGLAQETFEYFILNYGNKFKEIEFWKCPLVGDLRAIETLPDIESISYFWNQRATELWDFSKTPKLKKLSFNDFSRISSLKQVGLSESITELDFGDRVWRKNSFDTLSPLSNMRQLEKLGFFVKKIHDNRISPLTEIESLKELKFPSNQFSTEKIAWLTAKLDERVTCRCLQPYIRIEEVLESEEKRFDTFIVGKRKPFLDSEKDKKRIEKYERTFRELVEYYEKNRDVPEPD